MRKRFHADSDISEGKVFALLSYLGLLCIIPLILKKDNRFVLHHGKQGLVIFVGEVAVFIAHIILGEWFLRLGMFVLGVYSFAGIIMVLQGKLSRFPIVAGIADKISI